MTAPTLSGLGLVASCPGSALLPRQQRAGGAAPTLGTAIHEVCAVQVEGGDGGDIPQLWADLLAPDDAGRLAFLAEHLRLPVPPGALAEVPLGLFPDGSVRRIEGGAGSYPDVGQVLSGTLDAMWAEPEPLWTMDGMTDRGGHAPAWMCPGRSTLWLCDWKTGDEDNVPPIARNWQLRAGALLAARWTGARRVIPAIVFVNAAECSAAVREGRPYEGRWEVGAPLDAAALDAIEVELRAVLRAARGESDARCEGDGREAGAALGGHGDQNRGEVRSGGSGQVLEGRGGALHLQDGRREADPSGPPEPQRLRDRGLGEAVRGLVLGPWCERCPSRVHCPEFGAAARQLVEQSYLSPRSPVLMLPHERALLAAMIPAMRATLDNAEEALRAGGPVELADGRVYAPALEAVTSYRTQPTFDALAPLVGDDLANGAAEYTSASIKRALAEAGAPSGAFGRLRAEIEAAGGVVSTWREVWRRRYPAQPVRSAPDRADAPAEDAPAEDRPRGPVATKAPRANPLPASWMPSEGVRRMLRERAEPVIVEALMPAYRAAMAGQTAGRWTDRRFLRWVDERASGEAMPAIVAPALAAEAGPATSPVQLVIDGA